MGKFRFLHVGDTHLGFSGHSSRYNEYSALRIEKTTEEGINVRQWDVEEAYKQVANIAIEKKVDAILHAGDLFDFWGYQHPRLRTLVTREIARTQQAAIPQVIISGNHDLASSARVGHELENVGYLPGAKTVYRGFYEQFEIRDGVVIHCMPSTFTQQLLNEEIQKITPVAGKINIGMGHFGITSIKHFAEHNENTLVLDLDSILRCQMDYFALADYHKTVNFGNNIWYCGATERMGLDEINSKPAVLLVEIDEDTKAVEVEPIYLTVRPMIRLETVDIANIHIDDDVEKYVMEVNRKIIERIEENDLTDKIVRLTVKNLPKHIKKYINEEKIRELTSVTALDFRLELEDKIDVSHGVQTVSRTIPGIFEGFKNYVNNVPEDGSFNKAHVLERGLRYLNGAMHNVTP